VSTDAPVGGVGNGLPLTLDAGSAGSFQKGV
jgi:hypothetical protein